LAYTPLHARSRHPCLGAGADTQPSGSVGVCLPCRKCIQCSTGGCAGYVRALLERGASLEFFIEGGRSRDGRIGAPRLGLLALVVDAALDAPLARVRAPLIAIANRNMSASCAIPCQGLL